MTTQAEQKNSQILAESFLSTRVLRGRGGDFYNWQREMGENIFSPRTSEPIVWFHLTHSVR